MSRLRRGLAFALALVVLAAPACAPAQGGSSRTVTVLAASSLTEVFEELATQFEHRHPRTRVRLSFDSSATLAQQVLQGAPADVLATADRATMAQVRAAGLADQPSVFATNTLALVTPPDNPADVRSVRDLADPAVSVAVCARQVPCGTAARRLLRLNEVALTPVTLEPDVKSVLTKVSLGEVDAGLVYVTDARAARNQVRVVPLRRAASVINRYPVIVLADSSHQAAARAWVALLLSRPGRAVLGAAGFGLP